MRSNGGTNQPPPTRICQVILSNGGTNQPPYGFLLWLPGFAGARARLRRLVCWEVFPSNGGANQPPPTLHWLFAASLEKQGAGAED
jgi:hypothetical protein